MRLIGSRIEESGSGSDGGSCGGEEALFSPEGISSKMRPDHELMMRVWSFRRSGRRGNNKGRRGEGRRVIKRDIALSCCFWPIGATLPNDDLKNHQCSGK